MTADTHHPANAADDADPVVAESPSRRQLLTLGFAVAVARWVFAADRKVFHVPFDEPAQLAIGRTLAGRTKWNLFDLPMWQPGFGTLLAPVFMVTDNSTAVFRVAIGINALLGGVGAVLLALLAHRFTLLSSSGVLAASAAISLLPAGLSASAHAWAEPLVTVTFNATLLALVRHWDRPSSARAVAAIGFAGLGFLSHGRMGPMIAIAAIAVALRYRQTREWWRGAVWVAASMLLTSLIFGYSLLIRRLVWDEPDSTNDPSSVLERVTHPVAVVEAAMGQFWYLLVTSAMTFGIGMAVLARGVVHDDASDRSGRAARAILLASVVAMMGISAVFMSDRTERPDMMIYGRYNDAVVGIILVIGVGQLLRLWRNSERSTVAHLGGWLAVTGVMTVLLEVRRHTLFQSADQVDEMIAGLAPLPLDSINPALAVLACAGVVVLGLGAAHVTKSSTRIMGLASTALVASLGLLTFGGLHGADGLDDMGPAVGRIGQTVPSGTEFGARFVPAADSLLIAPSRQLLRVQLYQFHLPDHPFHRDKGFDDPAGPYVFAPRFNDEFVAQAELLWIDPAAPMALWLEPHPAASDP
jgi:hypothetical protein